MQPTIICTAEAPGMIYINGRFAGEASRQRPLFAPVSPVGAVYLEYRPLSGGDGALARKVVLSGGAPLADSLQDADGLACVAWPGGALEVEFSHRPRSREHFTIDGQPCAIERGESTALLMNGFGIPLPDGALPPRLIRGGGAAVLLGDVEGAGQYLAALPDDLSRLNGVAVADRFEPAGDGLFSAFAALGDSVGHGRLEQWLADASGLRPVSSEVVWADGAPHWPQTAEGAMIAAVEAMLAGLPAEAKGYLSPALDASHPLDAIANICDLCVPMKYGIPDPRPCVGLLKAVNEHLATVRPLYYRAEPSGGRQGPWEITAIESLGDRFQVTQIYDL